MDISIKKDRKSNIETYRILLMLAIVAHHSVVNSGLLDVLQTESFSTKTILYYFLGMWGKTGVNCFVLITGYFMCMKNITLQKYLKLLLEVIFYKCIVTLIFWISGFGNITMQTFLWNIWPIKSITGGFVECYLLFFLLIPYLNVLINNINKKEHLLLICLCTFIYTLLPSIPLIKAYVNYVEWFCVLYFISSYIRKYGICKEKSSQFWGGVLFVSVVLSMISVLVLIYKKIGAYWFVSDANHIMALVNSVCAFIFFKNINIPQNRIINTISSTVFGVLLIHANSDIMRVWLWSKVIRVKDLYYSEHGFLYLLFAILVVFVVCSIIDYFRILLVEKPFFIWIDRYVNKNSRESL